LYDNFFHNDLKFTTDGQQNQTVHEPRSRAFYVSINSLLHTCYYTELPMKVLITPHHLEFSYYGPPPIVITLGRPSPPRPRRTTHHTTLGPAPAPGGLAPPPPPPPPFPGLGGFFWAHPKGNCQTPNIATTATDKVTGYKASGNGLKPLRCWQNVN